MRTTPGRYLIQQALPDRFKQFDGALDAKAASALFTQMAKELSPEEYTQVTYRLNNLGNTIASEYGGVASIHLRDLRLPDNLRAMRDALQKKCMRSHRIHGYLRKSGNAQLSARCKKRLLQSIRRCWRRWAVRTTRSGYR